MADNTTLAELAPHAKIAAAAFAGGIVRLFLRPASSITQALMLISSCVTCGYFGQPAASYTLSIPAQFDGAVGALIGLFGLSLAQGVLKAIDRFDFRALLMRAMGIKQDGE